MHTVYTIPLADRTRLEAVETFRKDIDSALLLMAKNEDDLRARGQYRSHVHRAQSKAKQDGLLLAAEFIRNLILEEKI